MAISSISALTGNELLNYSNKVQSNNNEAFETVFQSALDLIDETDGYIKNSEEEEIKFATGASDSLIDLQNAQMKANISLQYTVTVKNAILEAYKEIMNMQF
ncbi:flagellar hook-basal body complex protein FliE [Anaeromicropila populeti]|uniref:Flagellar hook-basal body complex protein FliE n=1 Tax=Anaeromicropila populeti TaxID=37658 RepID=A0A1I6KX51_9FIRM|nr:flagellar hook-basal body complex protein FliE [Anaeromicropila populeti]SFR95812.1 flagellar hook-basal body complex protein FliE [Anaeromicropila populeti]